MAFFFKYNTLPEPLTLSIILLPAAAPTLASAPVISDSNTLPSRSLLAVANVGKKVSMKPHYIFDLCCSRALDTLIVAPFSFCHTVISFLACCCMMASTGSPCKSACFSFIDTSFFDFITSLILS